MVHCVHKFNLFKCRLWFIANGKHFKYAAYWIFKKIKFTINHHRLQQQATFLQLDCESKSWESSKSVVLTAFWRPKTLHLCRFQQQATFFSSLSNQMREKIAKLSKTVVMTLHPMNFSQETHTHRHFSTLCCMQSVKYRIQLLETFVISADLKL